MKFIADFHLHSHFSIATSKNLIPEYLDYWARLKGIRVIGTGDFTHPGWLKELKEKLEPSRQGLFRLKAKYTLDTDLPFLSSPDYETQFLLTAEISTIYKKHGRVRKVHNLLFVPDLETAEHIQGALSRIGNIASDGRPILGLDSRDLLEIVLHSSEQSFFVPAHIWTPWFSALGAQSGFDTIEECYDDLAEHIYAVETGLSSDPPMNWMCSFLDRYTLISNSDAHSPEKLGREANLFNTELSYDGILQAMKTGDPDHFLGTVEFFPQEGKYHYDGHRKCGIRWDPLKTLKHHGICPVCGKKVTIGVMNRVVQLADRTDLTLRKNRHTFYSLIPLREILSEITGVGPQSKKVVHAYYSLLRKAGSEFHLLLDMPPDEIKAAGNDILSEAVLRMRNREVSIEEGFDGEFGCVKVFQDDEKGLFAPQESIFDDLVREKQHKKQNRKLIDFDLEEYRRLRVYQKVQESGDGKTEPPASISIPAPLFKELNPEQQKAVEHFHGPALILAGPGTGKTRTLTCRIAHLILNKSVSPESILAVTFTNKAAAEMSERLKSLINDRAIISQLQISTFHGFGLSILKRQIEKSGKKGQFSIIDEEDKKRILYREIGCEKKELADISDTITRAKQHLKSADEIEDPYLSEIFHRYEKNLREQNILDLDDLIYIPVKIFQTDPEMLSYYRNTYRWISIDEYQDVNFAQYQMMKLLMPDADANLCVIGDPDQSIYGFRGADVKFIKTFMDDFPQTAIYTLTKSYRCSDYILKVSHQVIQSGSAKEKEVLEGLSRGVKIQIVENNTEKSEAEFVARTIEKMMGGLRFFSIDSQITEGMQDASISSLSDFVVLCRINRQMNALEKAFHDHNIPYQIVGDTPLFKKEPVKSIIDLLKLSIHPENTFLKNQCIEKKIIAKAEVAGLSEELRRCDSVKNKASTLINTYFNSEKAENNHLFRKLLDITNDFGDSLDEFLTFAALGTGVDTYTRNTEDVALMTLHSAKGLEFKCVFIVGCENGLIPYSLFKSQKPYPDEERRLLYVGMTRAKKFLFLSYAKKRFIFSKEYHLKRSLFLDSIEEELLELSKSEYKRGKKKEDKQPGLF